MKTSVLRGLLFLGLYIANSASAGNMPIGYIDGIVRENGQWVVNGWACEPGSGSQTILNVYLNNQLYASTVTNQTAEAEIHQLCGTSVSSGVLHRFTLSAEIPISGQKVRIDAVGATSVASINGSNVYGLPITNPESVIESASKILLLVAHEDDEILFSPMLAKYCSSKTCRVVTTTSNRQYHPQNSEFVNSMAYLPAIYDVGTFTSSAGNDLPHDVLNLWENEAANFGLINLNNVIKLEIDKFAPDVILTFDPRHGTSCHPEHRAVGQGVINGVSAYTGRNFNKSNLFLLTSRRIDLPEYSALVPAAPSDQFSVTYSAMDYIPARSMTGWDFFINIMGLYPSQFSYSNIQAAMRSPVSDRITAFLPIDKYIANDPRYTNSNAHDASIQNCVAF